MVESNFVYFLNDTIKQLIVMSKEIDTTNEYNKGILNVHYSAISRILNQAEAFDIIDELDKEIKDFVPESIIDRQ